MKKIFKILIFVLILFIILMSGFFYASDQIKTPLATEADEQTFVIMPGQGIFEIGNRLEQENLIRCRILFFSYVLVKGWGARLQAGEYHLSAAMNIPAIASKMVKGQTIEREKDITVTIPEGFNIKQIDDRLAAKGLIKEGELINFNKQQATGLEGYLFPDTYRFSKDSTMEQIIQKMLDNFDRKLDEDLRQEITDQGKTIDQIIIMASLLEKEVRTDEDRKILAGIFWQRLEDNYPLQSCATIAYILELDKWRYSVAETKIESLYNTYQNISLPPGPICNPGLSAIKAAIDPQANDYYFFLSKPDGQTVFSKTLEEHNQNIVKYLQ